MNVYVAGPLFSEQDRRKLEELANALNKMGLKVYLPHKHSGDLGSVRKPYGKRVVRDVIFEKDILEIRKADMLVTLLDGPDIDSGTAMEIGMAYQRAIPIFGLKTDFFRRGRVINNMIWGACKKGENLCFTTKELFNLLKREMKKKKATRAREVE